ncbi:MAG TPA: acyl-CoA dehydrogenase family protein [Acidimicrobiales bacterium]|nr:acyl-CoA dehydrogenase family protein [Acidimicrobiales bacterium]
MSDVVARAARLATGLAARAAEHDVAATFPEQDIAELRAEGLLGLMVPTDSGGLGAGFVEYCAVAMALARGSGATALLFNMHASVTGALAGVTPELASALGAGPEFAAERRTVLRNAADGALYAVAISEAAVGSQLSKLTTSYERRGAGYHLCGTKVACSGAGHADAYLVAARDSRTSEAVISYFLVPSGPGVVVRTGWDPLGMRATASHGIEIDVEVPARALLGVEGVSVLLAYTMPQWLVASYAAVYAGVAIAAVEEAAIYLNGRPGTPHTAVRHRLGRADAAARAAAAVVERAGRAVDEAPGDPETNRWIYRAKLVAGDAVMEVAAGVAEACGLGALSRGSPIERIFRDARLAAVMPPRSDLCADYLGATAVGLDPRATMEVPPW